MQFWWWCAFPLCRMRETRGLVESTRWQEVRAPASQLAPRHCQPAQMTRARRSIKREASSPWRRNSLYPPSLPSPDITVLHKHFYDDYFGFCSDFIIKQTFFMLTFLTVYAYVESLSIRWSCTDLEQSSFLLFKLVFFKDRFFSSQVF